MKPQPKKIKVSRCIKFTNSEAIPLAVSVTRFKEHLQIPEADNADDTILTACLRAAQEQCERYANIAIGTRNAVAYVDDFADIVEMYFSPVNSIASIVYDSSTTLSTDKYVLDNKGGLSKIYFKELPQVEEYVNGVEITCNIGFADLPESLIMAILLQATNFYEYREDQSPSNPLGRASKLLLNSYSLPYV